MEEIRHKLKQNKPEITESSLKAYVLNLRKLHQRLHGSKDFTGLDWLQDHEGVMKSLEAHCGSYLTCRNYLNAVIVGGGCWCGSVPVVCVLSKIHSIL